MFSILLNLLVSSVPWPVLSLCLFAHIFTRLGYGVTLCVMAVQESFFLQVIGLGSFSLSCEGWSREGRTRVWWSVWFAPLLSGTKNKWVL